MFSRTICEGKLTCPKFANSPKVMELR